MDLIRLETGDSKVFEDSESNSWATGE